VKDEQQHPATVVPRWVIEVPILVPPSADELARIRQHAAYVRAQRNRIGPIHISADDLVHASRRSDDAAAS